MYWAGYLAEARRTVEAIGAICDRLTGAGELQALLTGLPLLRVLDIVA